MNTFAAPTHSPYATLGRPLSGGLDRHRLLSRALAGNLVGDPIDRELWVSTPAGWDGQTPLPVAYALQGFTGHLSMWGTRSPFRPTPLEATDALFARDDVPPMMVVWVDGWSSVGGSQFIDSPVLGRWGTYVCEEVVGFVDDHYPTVRSPAGRAVTGKSSGGYGAMRCALDRPDVFGALATHAGDALFETSLAPELPAFVRALRDSGYDSLEAFRADFGARVPFSRPTDATLVELTGYACAYSGSADGTVALPFDLRTGEIVPAVWEQWLTHDPVRIARTEAGRAALAGLRGAWIDAGLRDEYFLDLGATAFRDAALTAGLAADRIHFELFDATHAAIEYRYPLALEWLARDVLER